MNSVVQYNFVVHMTIICNMFLSIKYFMNQLITMLTISDAVLLYNYVILLNIFTKIPTLNTISQETNHVSSIDFIPIGNRRSKSGICVS